MKRIRVITLCAAAALAVGLATYLAPANAQHDDHKSHATAAKAGGGPLANATVSFGAWMTSKTPPVDRFPNVSNTRFDNTHVIVPEVATIKAGGTVNFIIAGFHQVIIYGDGTKPSDIDTSIFVFPTNFPTNPPQLIADPDRRVYRGPDPSTQPADRVEAVHFAEPGTYLVICGVSPHFNAGMYGYVRVLP